VVEVQETPSRPKFSLDGGTATVRHVVPFQIWLKVGPASI